MKKALLLVFICVSIMATGCKKKQETGYEEAGGSSVQTLQDTGQIEAQYKDAIAKDPKNYEAIVGLGNLYFDAGKQEKAIVMYQKALKINPNHPNAEGLKQEISQARNPQTPESKSPSSGWVK